ncbi:MAG: pyrimidine dimer DNA glycosylase/endonuclease V, partial [Planctomycetota bacterium]
HLLGEHVEMHMFVGSLRRGHSVRGYTDGGLVDLGRIRARHRELAREMKRRGMRHRSPLPKHRRLRGGRIDAAANLRELSRRCRRCRARIRGRAPARA